MPDTTPEALTVPTAGFVLLHTPPDAASVSAVVPPAHVVATPVTLPATGSGLTVTTFVAAAAPQLLVTVYDIVVVPAAMPLTTPPVDTVPAAVFVLLHTPPPVASESVIVAPAHTADAPDMVPADAAAFTVTIADENSVPQELVTP